MLLCPDDRRDQIVAMATGVQAAPLQIDYHEAEHDTWRRTMTLLTPLWERYVALPLRAAQSALDLPVDNIPQLSLVSERLLDLTGFRYASVAGTVPAREFFGALSNQVFPSTQYIRDHDVSAYTPEPDVIHEVGGHAVSLANPQLASLHELAGHAAVAVADEPARLAEIAAVFWYTVEFGVVHARSGWKAYGTGLLSSPGELGWFCQHAQILPLDIATMIDTPYDIDHYQPVLFGADSLEHVLDVAGSYFVDVTNGHYLNHKGT